MRAYRDAMGLHNGCGERFDTVVVGGGQTGLTAGHHLALRDQSSVILDANE
jgi:cation diffusion facilitator CzcD-associated flavoprotein CzcO